MSYQKDGTIKPKFLTSDIEEYVELYSTEDVSLEENIIKGIKTPGWCFHRTVEKLGSTDKHISETLISFSGNGSKGITNRDVRSMPSFVRLPSIMPNNPILGDSVTLDVGEVVGNPAAVCNWNATINGNNINHLFDDFMAMEISSSGDLRVDVTWTNSEGSVTETINLVIPEPEIPEPVIDMNNVSSMTITPTISFGGDTTNITNGTTGGLRQSPITVAGTGANITRDNDYIYFNNAKRFRVTGTLDYSDGVIIAIKATSNNAASSTLVFGSNGTNFSFRIGGGRCIYNYTTGTSGNFNGSNITANEEFDMIAEILPKEGRIRMYSGGVISENTTPTPLEIATVSQFEVGQFSGRVKMFHIILKSDNPDVTMEDVVQYYNNNGSNFVPDVDVLRIMPAFVQSEARPKKGDSSLMFGSVGDEAVSIKGLINSVNSTPVTIVGIGNSAIDTTMPAIGFNKANGEVIGKVSIPFTALYQWLSTNDNNVIQKGIIVGDNGFGGIDVSRYNLTDAEPYGRNMLYWFKESVRLASSYGISVECPYLFSFIGTSGKMDSVETWKNKASLVHNQFKDEIEDVTGTRPTVLFVQTGSDVNAIGDVYDVTQAQLELARDGGGEILTSQRIYPIEDSNIHLDATQVLLCGDTCAWAISEIENGNKWTPWPTVNVVSNVRCIVSFDLRAGETLIDRSGLYSNYGGNSTCQNYGFESDVAIISVTPDFNGNSVEIEFGATPTYLKFAYQIQNVMSFSDASGLTMSSHRTTLFPSETLPSRTIDGEVLYRSLPSFKHTF